MNNSISLIGMAGAGKSSVGRELAKQLKFQFIDSDLLIEAKFNQTLQTILNNSGTLTISGLISGTNTLTLRNAGTTILSNNNNSFSNLTIAL